MLAFAESRCRCLNLRNRVITVVDVGSKRVQARAIEWRMTSFPAPSTGGKFKRPGAWGLRWPSALSWQSGRQSREEGSVVQPGCTR